MKTGRIEKEINPRLSIYLFSKDKPRGEIFKFVGGKDSEEYKAMLENGYCDSPAQLNLPKDNDVGITVEQAENADPTHLKIMLEKIGFIVLTPEQLKAEVNKFVDTHIDITEFTDEALVEEAERRGLKQSSDCADELNQLTDKFNESPKSLNKDELVALGNNGFSLGLRSNMKEETLIAKIKEALSAE